MYKRYLDEMHGKPVQDMWDDIRGLGGLGANKPERLGYETQKPLALVVAILFPVHASVAGSYFTAISVNTWFTTLEQPFFMPPTWTFGVVWSLLYLLMGIAFYLMLTTPANKEDHYLAWQLFVLQLIINVGWTLVFFALLDPLSALFGIIALLFLVTGTILTFWKINKLSAYLLLPYFFWLGFASLLNAAFIALNIS